MVMSGKEVRSFVNKRKICTSAENLVKEYWTQAKFFPRLPKSSKDFPRLLSPPLSMSASKPYYVFPTGHKPEKNMF